MLKVLCVIGTRPEGIKMAPVVRRLRRETGRIQCEVVHTGQHRELLDPILRLFDIRPDLTLEAMAESQSLGRLTARLFTQLDPVFEERAPDWILAQGDTTTVFATAMLAYYRRIRFGHVEAGLRTGDRFRPFPEEINRRVADLVADAYFAPTQRAVQTLRSEGVREDRIQWTGNTSIDALQMALDLPFDWERSPLAGIPQSHRLVLITAHRRESFGSPFRELCHAIRDLALRFQHENVNFIFPVHRNPAVRSPIHALLANLPNVRLLEPLDYLSLIHLMKRCAVILTDSGGIQEEAPTLGVPVLVLRETTERPEAVESGSAILVGTNRPLIVSTATRLLTDSAEHAKYSKICDAFGDGHASDRIVQFLFRDANLAHP